MIKDIIKQHQELVDAEMDDTSLHLEDLPNDIKDVHELNEIIGNNKDMSRAYDLGRLHAFEEFSKMLKHLRENC